MAGAQARRPKDRMVEPGGPRGHYPGMRKIILLLAFIFSSAGFSGAAWAREEQAVFAGGCFWCMEHDMQAIPGVISVMSGYTGGKERNPTYEQVSSETTGHYESVRVTFDPDKITYAQLLDRYWKLVDPTDNGGQFCDRGPSYRPAIFVKADQKAAAEASKAKLEASGKIKKKIIVPILPLSAFWPAEDYHRDFAKNNKGRYDSYRRGCGRDAVLKQVWGLD
jgi:peptide-methionine (S)-S-oxide reductase